jgi:hypothetical protein
MTADIGPSWYPEIGSMNTAMALDLLKLRAHQVTALARLHVQNLAQRSSLGEGSKREKKGGEERRIARKSVW